MVAYSINTRTRDTLSVTAFVVQFSEHRIRKWARDFDSHRESWSFIFRIPGLRWLLENFYNSKDIP